MKDLNVTAGDLRLLEENISKALQDIGMVRTF